MWTELDLRESLFCDVSVESFPPASDALELTEPWASFVHAKNALQSGEAGGAVSIWRRLTNTPGLESRHYLQAWYFLRQQGIQPPEDIARTLLGVVIEVEMGNGAVDLLAAYADHSARYYNYRGTGIVWDHPTNAADGYVDALFNASLRVVEKTAPREGARPTELSAGFARMSFLTPAGIHSGHGPMREMAKDGLAGPVLDASTALMKKLMQLGAKP